MGLAQTLMRNGYLTLVLPEVSPEVLCRAGVMVTVAPYKHYSERERLILRRFVEDGGILICTVGADGPGGSRELLADFGFSVGGWGGARGGLVPPEDMMGPPGEPWGHFKSPYFNGGDYMAYVRYHAGWPIHCDKETRVIAYGPGNVPVILLRPVGKGKVVLVGDTCFAMNKNLEREGGQPFEGMRENADFWRWFIAQLAGRTGWNPPRPPRPATASSQGSGPASGPAPSAPQDEEGEP
jgi:hypothetical protein